MKTTKLKIAFLGPAYPIRGGIAQFIALLAEKLSEKGNQVTIFSFKKQYPKLLFPGKEQLDKSKKTFSAEILPVLTPYNPITWIPAFLKIKNWKPNILILKYWIPFFAPAFGFVIFLLKLFSKTKVIFLIDNIEFHEKWILGNLLTKFALSKADKLITLSESVYKDALKLFPKKNVILGFHPPYSCYDLQKYNKQKAKKKLKLEKKKVILFFGYIKPYKGLDILLEAFPLILKTIPDSHLLIVGEIYGSAEKYDKLIEKNMIQKEITFIRDFVANEEIELFFKAADVLALPYKQATQSGVAQIGYDFGLGAVATPVGGLPEMVIHQKTGIIANTISSEDFAKAIIDFFELDKKELAKNIKIENKKISWESFAEIIL